MAAEILFNHLTREELKARAADSLVVLPVGATEQHGPHLAVGTDTFAVEHIARAAAATVTETIPVLVAPTLPYGSSHHHLPFGGTMSLETETYYRVVSDLVESLITSGFRKVFIVNGHGGNKELVELVVRDLALRHPVALAAASYWTIAQDALTASGVDFPNIPGHASAFETSVILALNPALVREPRPSREGAAATTGRRPNSAYRAEFHGSWTRIDGYTDSPAAGTAARGQSALNAIVPAVAQALLDFFAEAQEALKS